MQRDKGEKSSWTELEDSMLRMTAGHIPIHQLQPSWHGIFWPTLLPWRSMSELRKRRSRLVQREQQQKRAMALALVAEAGADVANFLQQQHVLHPSPPPAAAPPPLPLLLQHVPPPSPPSPHVPSPPPEADDPPAEADDDYEIEPLEVEETPAESAVISAEQPQPPSPQPPSEADESSQCPICLEDMEAGVDDATCTKCKHAFHFECARRMVAQARLNRVCPLCRHPLPSNLVDRCILLTSRLEFPTVERVRGSDDVNLTWVSDDAFDRELADAVCARFGLLRKYS